MATKSVPALAVPSTVAKSTLEVPDVSPTRETVKTNSVVPAVTLEQLGIANADHRARVFQ